MTQVADRAAIRRALLSDQTIDIVTIGARTGKRRRIEIWFVNLDGEIVICGTVSDHRPGVPYPRDWLANLAANPSLTFCLKESVDVELPARAEIVSDPAERRRIMSAPQTSWYREQGETLDDLVAGAPIVRITFVDEAAWLES